MAARLKMFVLVAVVRPIRMLLLEPITGFSCLYVAAEFGTLFSFFAAVPYTFGSVYQFSIEESGLVFLSIVIGCFLGLITETSTEIPSSSDPTRASSLPFNDWKYRTANWIVLVCLDSTTGCFLGKSRSIDDYICLGKPLCVC
ncbi:hypothetical protein LB503_001479 [Fusarium chuoi]|nr:hypothetical protein LB503_001479 [Fusarium chuoi]